ncbi:MAG: autotransporter domain-containing protein [Hyphomicrobiales bacterium]
MTARAAYDADIAAPRIRRLRRALLNATALVSVGLVSLALAAAVGDAHAQDITLGQGDVPLTYDLATSPKTIGSLSGPSNSSVTNGGSTALTLTTGDTLDTTFSGVIQDGSPSGTVALTKQGTDTFTLTGLNTYSGGTTVTGGNFDGLRNITGGGTLAISSEANIGGPSGGGITLNNGTLQFLAGTPGSPLTISQTVTLGNGDGGDAGAFDVHGNVAAINGRIAGAGALILNDSIGGGNLRLTGANTYSEGTIINAGTLTVTSDGNLGTGYDPIDAPKATITFGGGTLEIAQNGFSSNRPVNLDTGGGTIDVSGNAATLSGVIQDVTGAHGSLTLTDSQGGGMLTLTGTSNTYSGTTTITGGTLQGGAANAFSPFSSVLMGAGTTLDLGGFDQAIASLADTGSFGHAPGAEGALAAALVTNNGTDFATLTTGGDGTNTSFSGDIKDGSQGLGLTKTGGGIFTLSGTQNTYSGPTIILGGTLLAGATNALSPNSQFRVDQTEGLPTLDIGGFDQIIGSLADGAHGGGTVTNSSISSSATLKTGGDGSTTSFSGTIQDGNSSLALTKQGSGTFTLSGTNTYTGTTTVSAGTLQVDGIINAGIPGIAGSAASDGLAGVVNVSAGATLTGAGTINGPVTIANGGILAGASGQTLTMASLVLNSGSNVDVTLGAAGGSKLFDVTNDLTFGTTPNSVTLNVTNTPLAGVYHIFTYGGSLNNPTGLAVGSIPGGQPATINTATAQQVNLILGASSAMQFWHPNSEGGFGGSGTWSSSNANWSDQNGQNATIWGGKEGIFQGTPGTVTVQGAQGFETLEFVVSGYRLVTGEGIGSLTTNGTGTLWAEGADATIAVPIDGSGNITKIGTGTISLTRVNSYSGGTFIDAGTLAIAQDANLGAANGGVTFNGGALQFSAANVALAASRTIMLDASGGTIDTQGFNGSIAGNIVDGSGAQGSLAESGTGVHGSLTKIGSGTLTLFGTSSYSGATNVDAGILQAGAAGAFSPNSAFSIASGATLDLNSFAQTLGSIGGAGTIALGSAILTQGGDNSDQTFSGNITGTGGLTKTGTGRLNFTGTGTYTGQTTISGGTLSVNGSLVSGVTVGSGGTLGGNGTVGSTTILPGGTLSPGNSIGAITVNGNLGFGAGSTYAVEVNSLGASDFTHVTGKTTIAGGTVGVLAASGTYQPSTTYKILTSDGGVSGTFSGATTNFAFLTPTLSYDPQDVLLTLQRNDINFQQAAQPGNPNIVATALQNAVNQFDRNILNSLGPNDLGLAFALANGALSPQGLEIIERIDNLTGAGANLAFNSLSGEGAAAAPEASFLASRLFSSTMLSQASFWRGGGPDPNGITASEALGYAPIDDQHIAPFDKMGGKQMAFVQTPLPRTWRIWYTALGGLEQLPGDNAFGIAKSSARAVGGAGGVDYQINANFLVGFAAGGTDGSFSTSARSTQGSEGGMHIGVYGAANFGHLYATAMLDGGYFSDHLKRYIIGVGPTELATARFTENEFGGRLELGWKQGFGNFKVSPFAALEARRVGMPAFTEATALLDGTPGILGLSYGSQSVNSVRSYLGANIEAPIDLGDGRELTPNLRLAWVHEFDRTRRIGAYLINLPGADFSVDGSRPARDSLEANIGAQLGITQNVKLFANFDGDFAHGGHSYAGMAGLKIIFDDLPHTQPGSGSGAGASYVFSSREAAKTEEDALFPRLVREPQNLDLAFHFSEVASAAGDYEAAVGALERMRFYNADLPRVELELGVLYFRLGSYKMALSHFEAAVSAPDTPEEVRKRVAEFQREIEKRLNPNQYALFGQAGLRYQTNANAGPSNTLVKALGQDAVLNSQFTRKADWNAFGLASGRYIYDFGNQRGDGWQTDLTAYYARQFKVTRLNLGIAEVQTGPRLAVAPDALPGLTFHPYLIGNAATLGDNPYLTTLGAGAALDYTVGGDLALEPSLEFRRRSYRNSTDYQTAKQQTGDLVNAAFAATGAISSSVRWQSRVTFSTATANQTFDEYRLFGIDAGLPIDFYAPFLSEPRVWTVTPMAGYSLTRYGGPNPLVDPTVTRQDGEWHTGISLDAPLWPNAGFAAQIMFQRVNSTLRNYDTRNFSVSAGPTVRF